MCNRPDNDRGLVNLMEKVAILFKALLLVTSEFMRLNKNHLKKRIAIECALKILIIWSKAYLDQLVLASNSVVQHA